MAHVSMASLRRRGSSKLFEILLNNFVNNTTRRQLKISTSTFCAAPQKDAMPYSPTSGKAGLQAAAPPTVSQQSSRTTQYEPTLIANPTTATIVKSDSSQTQQSSSQSHKPDSSQFQQSSPQSQSLQPAADSTMTEIRAINQDIKLSKRDLSNILNQVDPRTLNKVYYFDSLALSKKLEAKGFTRDQAEVCVECLLEVVGNTLEHQAKYMITKAEQKIVEQQLQTEIMSVKKDMVLLQKSEFSALRTETEKISVDIDRIQSHFQDEVVKLKGQFTLDVNLERGRAVEAHAVSEKNLQMLNNKIETEIAHLKTTYEVYRNDIFKYAAGTVLTCTTLIIGFIRLWT